MWQVGTADVRWVLLFYLVTNFAIWATRQLYPTDGNGPAGACYMAAIFPTSATALLGDFGFTAILFGGLALLEYAGRMDARKTTMPDLAVVAGRSHAHRFVAGQRHGDCLRPGRGRLARRPVARMRQPAVGEAGSPSCTRPAFDVSMPSGQIDAEVRAPAQGGRAALSRRLPHSSIR